MRKIIIALFFVFLFVMMPFSASANKPCRIFTPDEDTATSRLTEILHRTIMATGSRYLE